MNAKFKTLSIIGCILLLLGELFARYCLGLGSPPLYIEHKEIKYMLKPNQNVQRFGNRVAVNEFGMRSRSLNPSDNLKILVFGDSVLNGGSLTDHEELATTLLENALRHELSQSAWVGNVSAGSWGPGNWLAYAKEFGFFDADVVLLIISSDDYADTPSFSPLNQNTHPTKKPISALTEGFCRYLPRYLTPKSLPVSPPPSAEHMERGLSELREFLLLAKDNAKQVVVLNHWSKSEMELGGKIGNVKIVELCESLGVQNVQLRSHFAKKIKNGTNLYRDDIHLNSLGQKLVAQVIFENIDRSDFLALTNNRDT